MNVQQWWSASLTACTESRDRFKAFGYPSSSYKDLPNAAPKQKLHHSRISDLVIHRNELINKGEAIFVPNRETRLRIRVFQVIEPICPDSIDDFGNGILQDAF